MKTQKYFDIDLKIKKLENDYINGSSVIALNSLKIFTDSIEFFSNTDNFIPKIKEIAKKIIKAKPTMASLSNIINYALLETIKSKELNSQNVFKTVNEKINSAKTITLKTAIDKITEDSFNQIITCSYSSTVINLFRELKQKGYNFKVILLESTWKGIKFCENMQKECNNLNIQSQIVIKENIPNYDFAIIGADSIIDSQGIINGTPSEYLARYCYEQNFLFYVIGESYKKSRKIILEDGFEFIKNKYISDIFTDNIFDTKNLKTEY